MNVKLTIPIILSILAFVSGTIYTFAHTVVQVSQLRADIERLNKIVEVMNMAQLELARRGQWMHSVDTRLSHLESEIDSIDDSDRFTKTEAMENHRALMRMISEIDNQ
jgi:hypothetical protein